MHLGVDALFNLEGIVKEDEPEQVEKRTGV